MGRPSIAVLAIFVAAMAFGTGAPGRAGAGTPRVTGDPGSGWIPDVYVAGTALDKYNPTIATAPNGKLYAAYDTGAGNIEVKNSTDAGLSWGVVSNVANTSAGEYDPAMAIDPFSGRAFVAYYVSPGAQIEVAWSDDGTTWTSVLAYDCDLSALYVGCGDLQIAVEYWNGAANRVYVTTDAHVGSDDYDVLVLRSDDHGASWNLALQLGLGFTGTNFQPAIAVQRGTDATDRVIAFYRSGPSVITAMNGFVEWSEDHGGIWHAPVRWTTSGILRPAIAAAHDGSSVLVAAPGTTGADVQWFADLDPTDLTTTNLSGVWIGFGYETHIAPDGAGSTSTAIGGRYHIIAAASPALHYRWADVDLSAIGPVANVTDAAADVVGVSTDMALTTQSRGGAWWANVVWTDYRTTLYYTIWYSTEGAGLTVSTAPAGLGITVDGTSHAAPFTAAYPAGSLATIGTSSPQTGGPGIRYEFASWSDGGAVTHAVSVTNVDVLVTASFATQYAITIDSTPSGRDVVFNGATQTTPATYWLSAGTYRAGLVSPQTGAPGKRYVFASWSDGGAQAHDVAVSSPITLTATFGTEYQLTITSAHGTVEGAGWYPAGSVASPRVTATSVTENGTSWEFTSWTGDLTGTDAHPTLTMDGPKSITANWRQAQSGPTGIPTVLIALIGVLVVALLVLALLWRRRRRAKPDAAPPTPPTA